MPRAELAGIYNIVPTSFRADGTLDLNNMKRLTRFVIERGVDGLTILGVLGEADKLTESEREAVIATVVEASESQVPVCVGTTHTATDGCIAQSRTAQSFGARAVMVAPPRLARSSQAPLLRHYIAVLKRLTSLSLCKIILPAAVFSWRRIFWPLSPNVLRSADM